MSTHELTNKIRQLKELQDLIDEANSEAEAIKDELKALMLERKTDEMSVDVFKVRYVEVKSNRFPDVFVAHLYHSLKIFYDVVDLTILL